MAAQGPPPSSAEASRQSRPPQLQLDEAQAIERALDRYSGRPVLKPFTEGRYGVRAKAGGILPGSGFAAGPEFIRRHVTDGGVIRASGRISTRKYYLLDAELALPQLAGGLAFLNLLAVHRSLPRMPYHGQGPASPQAPAASFHLTDTNYELTAGVRPTRGFRLGATGGYLQASAADSPFLLNREADFATAGGFAELDYTDHPGSPRSGGDYSIRFTNYDDRATGLGSHRRYDLQARQYIPFFNRQRVIALRAYSVLTGAERGRAVPFYLQPTLGGPDTLRGFTPFRFYDNNLVLFNAEYRWKISSGVEMALFVDRGKVFPSVSRFDWEGMESSYGFGTRLNARQNVFFRMDLGCSREGCQLWLRFNNVY